MNLFRFWNLERLIESLKRQEKIADNWIQRKLLVPSLPQWNHHFYTEQDTNCSALKKRNFRVWGETRKTKKVSDQWVVFFPFENIFQREKINLIKNEYSYPSEFRLISLGIEIAVWTHQWVQKLNSKGMLLLELQNLYVKCTESFFGAFSCHGDFCIVFFIQYSNIFGLDAKVHDHAGSIAFTYWQGNWLEIHAYKGSEFKIAFQHDRTSQLFLCDTLCVIHVQFCHLSDEQILCGTRYQRCRKSANLELADISAIILLVLSIITSPSKNNYTTKKHTVVTENWNGVGELQIG